MTDNTPIKPSDHIEDRDITTWVVPLTYACGLLEFHGKTPRQRSASSAVALALCYHIPHRMRAPGCDRVIHMLKMAVKAAPENVAEALFERCKNVKDEVVKHDPIGWVSQQLIEITEAIDNGTEEEVAVDE